MASRRRWIYLVGGLLAGLLIIREMTRVEWQARFIYYSGDRPIGESECTYTRRFLRLRLEITHRRRVPPGPEDRLVYSAWASEDPRPEDLGPAADPDIRAIFEPVYRLVLNRVSPTTPGRVRQDGDLVVRYLGPVPRGGGTFHHFECEWGGRFPYAEFWTDGDGFPAVYRPGIPRMIISREDALDLVTTVIGFPVPDRPPTVGEEEIRFRSGEVLLGGTFTHPRGRGPFPFILLLGGSAAEDRDYGAFFREIAYALGDLGWASFRFDPRGLTPRGGSSSGQALSTRVADSRAAIAEIREKRPIDPRRIVLLGHSEGGMVAPLVACEENDVLALIVLGTPSHPFARIGLGQIQSGYRDAAAQVPAEEMLREFILSVDSGKPFYREHRVFDPLDAFARAARPTLIVHGERDWRVPVGEARRLFEQVRSIPGSALRILSGQDHQFTVRFGDEDLGYRAPTVDGRLLESMRGFLESLPEPEGFRTLPRLAPAIRAVRSGRGALVAAVGDGGTILISRDGGGSWKRHELPGGDDLVAIDWCGSRWLGLGRTGAIIEIGPDGPAATSPPPGGPFLATAIAFRDDRIGHAVGWRGTVLRTEDGGRSWTQSHLPGSPPLRSLAYHAGEPVFSTSAGTVIAMKGSEPRVTDIGLPRDPVQDAIHLGARMAWQPGRHLISPDGGFTWREMPFRNLRRLFSPGAQTLIALEGGRIDRSSDGGRTWTKMHPYGAFRLVDFVDPETGWALSQRSLFRTTDGGKRWEDFEVPLAEATGMHFETRRVGMAWSPRELLLTGDGGRTWRRVSRAGRIGEGRIVAVAMQDPDRVFVLVVQGASRARVPPPGTEVLLSRLLHTADGGEEWETCHETPPPLMVSLSLERGRILAGTEGGAVLVSDDLGKTFRQVKVRGMGPLPGWPIVRAERGEIRLGPYVSTDGGETWTDRAPLDLRALVCLRFSGRTGTIASAGGAIYRYDPEGGAIELEYASPRRALHSVQLSKGGLGFTVGEGGLVLRRSPDGPWVPVRVPTARDLFAADFAAGGAVGWIVGDFGTVLRTTDGGRDWQALTLPEEDAWRGSGRSWEPGR